MSALTRRRLRQRRDRRQQAAAYVDRCRKYKHRVPDRKPVMESPVAWIDMEAVLRRNPNM